MGAPYFQLPCRPQPPARHYEAAGPVRAGAQQPRLDKEIL